MIPGILDNLLLIELLRDTNKPKGYIPKIRTFEEFCTGKPIEYEMTNMQKEPIHNTTLPAEMRLRVKQGTDSPDINMVAEQLEGFVHDSIKKYDQGWKEHGGSILSRPCLSEARKEVIDLNFYLGAIEEKKKDIVSELKGIISGLDKIHGANEANTEQRLIDIIKAINNL